MVIISAVVCIYYNVIIAYAIYYMFVSFVYLDDDLPWANCKGFWATDSCRDRSYPDFTNASGEVLYNITSKESYIDSSIAYFMLSDEVNFLNLIKIKKFEG